ncbi:MAG: alpha/beta fold hydrolase, partial [Spirochaetia bacterium]
MKGIFKSELGKKSVLKSYGLLLEQWGTEYTEVSAETDYGKTQVITAGNPSKPPLLLFHGVGDNSALMWVFNAAVLAEHYYVIAVDTIGGPGKSEPNRNYYTGIDHIKWIEQVTGQFGISTMYTAGVSNGAYLAQLLTVRKPDTVIKSVIMSGTAAVKGGTAGMMKMMRVFLPEALFSTEKNVIRLLRKLSGPGHHIFTENKELLNHWSLLLKYFNPRAMSPHKYTVISPAELD